eukprot:scaffold217_cov377-Prasinococcus_capsulatus_cf.AAC.33
MGYNIQDLRFVYRRQNLARGTKRECQEARLGDEWRCIFPQNLAPYVQSPLFAIQSKHDKWQLLNTVHAGPAVHFVKDRKSVERLRGAELDAVVNGNFSDADMLSRIEGFAADLSGTLHQSLVAAHSHSGAFITGCISHCNIFDPAVSKVRTGVQALAH